MARDQIEVDLLLNAKKAEATIKQMNRELGKMGKTMGQAFSGTGGGASNNIRALGTGLSKATVRADEFSKSLEASNARVIAFGASAGLIMNVDRALRAMVKTTIQVEKAMADVNVVMNISSKQLDQFGKGMFKVAKETAQGFSTVAEASTELARQGLGMEKTLARTKDALILTRLTGMNAADAVKSLTAAVNSFNKEGTTSSQVINRMAKVDAAFAVSSEDLAKAISRVGSSAVDAGVSLNQLMAITTSVQQKTARGGAVIGNAFKTIFTRIQRSDVRKTLSDIGVATTDMSGKMLDGVTVLENLSKSFGRLTKVQQASVAESVAGVFQVNILRAAMSDLSTKNSEYAKALRVANSATNEAYKRNEQLNQTLDALANKTMVNLTQAGAALGGDLFGPAIKKVLGTVNSTLESFGKGGAMEGIGQTIGKGLVTGIGNFIGGPGLIIATAVFGKLALNLSKFATTAFKDIMGINTAVKQRAALEEIVVNTLASEPALLQKVKMGTLSVLDVEKQILATIKQQQVERAALKGYGGAIAGSLHQRGTRVGSSGRAFNTGMGRMGKASGFVPNFANANSERAAAAAGGYTAGAIKTMSQPGAGTMMYNSAETVKQFPGMSQKAIMPPSNSSAGANYRSTFGAAHGFDPYAAGGFVPNFARRLDGSKIGIALGFQGSKSAPQFYSQPVKNLSAIKGIIRPNKQNEQIQLSKVQSKAIYNPSEKESDAEAMFKNDLNEATRRALGSMAGSIIHQLDVDGKPVGQDDIRRVQSDAFKRPLNLPEAFEGQLFEEALRIAVEGANVKDKNASFDFEENSKPSKLMQALFDGSKDRIDAKRQQSAADNMVNKFLNDSLSNKPVLGDSAKGAFAKLNTGIRRGKIAQLEPFLNSSIRQKTSQKRSRMTNAALGFIPNFSSPLGSSVGREMAAGIPASAIRVGSSPALRSSKNPSGLGVYNTKDEPMGLNQGISRSRSMGINPKSHGAAGGFVPNFNLNEALGMGSNSQAKFSKAATTQEKAAKTNNQASDKLNKGADKMMMAGMMINMALSGAGGAMGASEKVQGGLNAVSNIGGMAMMGAGFGLPGVIAGGALGALTSGDDISAMFGFKDAEIAARKAAEDIQRVSASLSKAFVGLSGAFDVLDSFDSSTPLQRIKALKDITDAVAEIEGTEATNPAAASIIKRARKDLNLDEILRTGGKSGLPKGGVLELQKELENVTSEILAANQRGSLEEMTTGFLGGRSMRFKSISEGTHSVGKQYENKLGIEHNLQQFKSSYTPELQAALLSTEGGVEDLKSIKEKVTPLGAGTFSGKEDFTQTIVAATKMAAVLKGAGFEALGSEMFEAADKAEKEKKSGKMPSDTIGSAGSHQRGLQRMLFSLFNDEGLAGLSNPEAVAAGTITPEGTSSMSQADFNSRRRAGRIKRADDFSGMGVKLNRRLGRIRRDKASSDLGRSIAGNLASATMYGDDLIEQQGQISKAAAVDQARASRGEIRANQQAKLGKQELTSLGTLIDTVSKTAKNLDDKNDLIKKYNKTFKGLEEDAIKEKIETIEKSVPVDDEANNIKTAELQFLEKRLIDLKSNAKEEKGLIGQVNATKKSQIENTEALTEAQKQARQELLKFQIQIKRGQIEDNVIRTKSEAAGLRALQKEGYGITEREIADADRAARRADIRAGNSKGNPMAAFRESFAYGSTDAILEFEDGVVSVANSMKSSFADAFRSIGSGATSVKGALANMAQGILDSISQVSSNMFANIMMSKMAGYSQGGYVQGYNSGGLITGGSGYKDDVPIRATGGEFVIKKSAVNKIGLPTLNSINGMANGGMSMGKMALVSAGASAASGLIGSAMQPGAPDVPRSQNYGMGRSKHGYLGGADPDAGGSDMISGRGGRASVSLNKAYAYYRRDPQTGQLISERARPTEGRFEVSDNLSLLGRLGEDDPQTARMFQKEQAMSKYQGYLSEETDRRKAAVKAVERKKRSNLIQAYANAAMLIGGAKFGQMGQVAGSAGGAITKTGNARLDSSRIQPSEYSSFGYNTTSSKANGGMIATMGGEYIMSPEAVRTHGINFMTELNRGNAPGYASGGLVGSAPAAGGGGMVGGSTTNNVSISVNIDKNGKASADSSAASQQGGESAKDQQYEIDNNKELGQVLKAVVLQEMVKQQRPGGLLNRSTTGVG